MTRAESIRQTGRLGRNALGSVIEWFVTAIEWFGNLTVFCAQVLSAALTSRFEWAEAVRQMDQIGTRSLPLIALSGAATGIVLAMQTRGSLSRFGAKGLLPAVVVFSLIRETAPIITGLVGSGRVGAGIGAELGSMKVTEQIDALEATAVNPYSFLALTRIIACVFMFPLLTLVADAAGILMGWLTSNMFEPISLSLFLTRGFHTVEFNDFLPPTFKTAAFGLIIGVVATFQGMKTQGGTEGIGRAATSSVVLSSLFIVVADVFLVRLIMTLFP